MGGFSRLLTLQRWAKGGTGSLMSVRFRTTRKDYRWFDKPPRMNAQKWRELAEFHAKKKTIRQKIPWHDIFDGTRPIDPVTWYKNKPDWRKFNAATLTNVGEVIQQVSFGTKALFWVGYGGWAVASLLATGITFLLIRTYGFELRTLAGPSMLPTFNLNGSEIVFVRRSIPQITTYEVGEVVLANPPGSKSRKVVAKRIRAMEGDTIVLEDGAEFILPKDHVWLQGDNPHQSADSRSYGPVELKSLRGKLKYRVFPTWGKVENDFVEATEEISSAWDSDKGYAAANRNWYIANAAMLLAWAPIVYLVSGRRMQDALRKYRKYIASGGKQASLA